MALMVIARDDPNVRVLATIANIEAIPRVGDTITIRDPALLAGGTVAMVEWRIVNVAAGLRRRRRPPEWTVEVWVWLK